MASAQPIRIVGFSGSQGASSRTRALVDLAAARAAARFGASAATYDLADLQPSLGGAQHLKDLAPLPRAIVQSLMGADALIIGVPVYKGSYPGLFKHLFDLIDPAALTGKPILLTATGGGEKHALVIEHQLRPLFGCFEAASLPTGVYASAGDFSDGLLASAAVHERLERAVSQFSQGLHRPPVAAAA